MPWHSPTKPICQWLAAQQLVLRYMQCKCKCSQTNSCPHHTLFPLTDRKMMLFWSINCSLSPFLNTLWCGEEAWKKLLRQRLHLLLSWRTSKNNVRSSEPARPSVFGYIRSIEASLHPAPDASPKQNYASTRRPQGLNISIANLITLTKAPCRRERVLTSLEVTPLLPIMVGVAYVVNSISSNSIN